MYWIQKYYKVRTDAGKPVLCLHSSPYTFVIFYSSHLYQVKILESSLLLAFLFSIPLLFLKFQSLLPGENTCFPLFHTLIIFCSLHLDQVKILESSLLLAFLSSITLKILESSLLLAFLSSITLLYFIVSISSTRWKYLRSSLPYLKYFL